MDSVDQTLRRAREVEEKYKKLLERKAESDKSMEETFKKIQKTEETLQDTKKTIGTIDQLYDRLQKVLSESIDKAVASVEKNTLVTVAEPGFQPNRVQVAKVAQMLKEKKKILILTGAGMSAASGIPTFRGDGGFWRKEAVEISPNDPTQKIDPQIILTSAFYSQHPAKTWEWLRKFYELKIKSKPNKGHIFLSEVIENLRARGKQVCIVTQNIDNFHREVRDQRIAKNKNIKDYPIYQIHGNILKIRCNHCSIEDQRLYEHPFQSYIDILEMKPRLFCPRCEGPLRPHVMFFDQTYQEVFHHSDSVRQFLKDADAVIVIGTSLSTGLAHSIVVSSLQSQKQIVEINSECQIRKSAAWWLQDKAEVVLESLKIQMIKK